MNKMTLALVAALLATAPVVAHAEEGMDTAAPATTEAPAAEMTKSVTLADGTVVQIEGDHVYVVDTLGEKTAAPDGDHPAADGTVIKVKDGMLVKDETAPAPTDEAAPE
ncbi:MAG: hypothetical protein H6862_06365 [Rhodospirillales bacterium]|nr:hypothetical protein [Rhodospirillales bacterium]